MLLILLVIPLFDVSYWDIGISSYDMNLLDNLYSSNDSNIRYYFPAQLNLVIDNQANYQIPLLILQNTDDESIIYEIDNYPVLRENEQTVIITTNLKCIYSNKYSINFEALLNMMKTIFICFVFIIGTLLFSRDAQEQVITPLERMIQKVNFLAANQFNSNNLQLLNEEEKPGVAKETAILENAITKIAKLLSLGFGEAGKSIITQNIVQGGDVEPFLAGNKILAIFGFCDIRHFTDVTEVLEEEVMVYVNSIANIVHEVTDKYLGQPNKNIGDAFLIVWKFPSNDINKEIDQNGGERLKLVRSHYVANLADLSIISFLTVMAKIYKSEKLNKYKTNQNILSRLPNYSVKMGFGLDQGWAIEGAIGSEFKIDASYLSPHVNLSSRMEAATKQYGVPFLISSNVYNILSPEMRKICRKIDVVTVKGSKVPITLYTINISLERLDSKQIYNNGSQKNNKSLFANEGNIKRSSGRIMRVRPTKSSLKNRFDMNDIDIGRNIDNLSFSSAVKIRLEDTDDSNRNECLPKKIINVQSCQESKILSINEETKKRIKLKKRNTKKINLNEGILKGKIQASKLLETKRDLRKMIVRDHEFDILWNEVMDSYINGDWNKAKILLDKVKKMREFDGPAKTLHNFLKDNNFESPKNWEGFRVLVEK